MNYDSTNAIAIIGLAGRFPQAKNVDEFWRNLAAGKDCITFYSEEELIREGIPREMVKDPSYVRAKGELSGVEEFDAAFFDMSPQEAEVTDPQHRLLLECSWEALEHAGYNANKYDGRIGVFAGKSMEHYLLINLLPHEKKEISATSLRVSIGNDKDSLTTLIAYRLNLTGPGITIQTSSSTSLVAVCEACRHLLTLSCDIALAGGVCAGPPVKSGYMHYEGGIWSRDGATRTFDDESTGFVPASGMGMVVLKRMEDALADGDTIWAVIKGFAVNNDGKRKANYAAPSFDGQIEVVLDALSIADVPADSIQYVEAHGTGTHLGDPIEMNSLIKAFRTQTQKKGFCAVGSVKSNIGHLDNAAGVAGLIKVVLSLKERQIPASLHYKRSNREIDFANSPFYVNTKLQEWITNGTPRRGAVTSLGMGGTNAHVVLEEAPEISPPPQSREPSLLTLSAKNETSLQQMHLNLINHLAEGNSAICDVAYTLNCGRGDFTQRSFVVCTNTQEAIDRLSARLEKSDFYSCTTPSQILIFFGSGVEAGVDVILQELCSRVDGLGEHIAELSGQLSEPEALHLKQLLNGEVVVHKTVDNNRLFTFALYYGIYKFLITIGMNPAAIVGTGRGEIIAACAAGLLDVRNAYHLYSIFEQPVKFTHAINETTFHAAVYPVYYLPEATDGNTPPAAVWREKNGITSYRFNSEDKNMILVFGGNHRIFKSVTVPAQPVIDGSPLASLYRAIGLLWAKGCSINWIRFYGSRRYRRIPLPGYPFNHKRFWIDPPPKMQSEIPSPTARLEKKHDTDGLGNGKRDFITTAYVAPTNDKEWILVGLIEEIVGVKPVGSEDDFFLLGIDSLSVIIILTKIKEKLSVSLDMEMMYKYPTAKQLAEHI